MDRRADLVVMSTHGRTGLGRALTGSVAGEVLRTGRVPVVLVGPASALETQSARATAATR
jgi:nucleotide-binding universal stress UspA family protein